MSNDNLKKLKDEELKILDYFAEFCEKNNLNYYIMYGTLLGAVRHKGFIPWDDDIDVCMPPADYQKFIKIFKNDNKYFLQTIETDKYFHTLFAKIRENNTCMVETENTYMKIHKGINIDIFPLIPYPVNNNKWFIFKFKFASLLVCKNIKTNNIKNKVIFAILRLVPRKVTNKIAIRIMNSLLNYNGNYLEYKMEINDKPLKTEWFKKSNMIAFEDRKYIAPYESKKILEKLYGDYMKLPPENERIGHGNIILSFNKSYDDLEKR